MKNPEDRKIHIKSLENMNEFDRLIANLKFGELSITHLELAYREYLRRRKNIPEGVTNLLVPKEHAGLINFASDMREIAGNIELAYRRGIQEGKEFNQEEQ